MKMLNCIMLVDDDNSTNYLHKIIIEEMEIAQEISISLNGREALKKIRSYIKNDTTPDLIFLDINMPVMDGFEFLEEFQKFKFTSAGPIVIMVTSSSHPDDIEKAQQLSVAEYISKPLEEKAIAKVFHKYFPSTEDL